MIFQETIESLFFSIKLYEEGIEQRNIVQKEVVNGSLISM